MEVVIWTLIFLGGDLAVLVFLLFWSYRKDQQKRRLAESAPPPG